MARRRSDSRRGALNFTIREDQPTGSPSLELIPFYPGTGRGSVKFPAGPID